MAKFAMGALTSYVKGSTKNSTFRNTKAGVVVYDRIDPAKWGGKYGMEQIMSRAQFNFMVACDLAAKLGVLPANATIAAKRGTKYNEFVKLLIAADPFAGIIENVQSTAYGQQATKKTWLDFLNDTNAGGGFGEYQLAVNVLARFIVGGADSTLPAKQICKGVGNASYVVTLAATGVASVAVSNLVNKSRKVKVLVIDGMNAARFEVVNDVIPALSQKTIATTLVPTKVTNQSSAWYDKFVSITIVMADNRPVNADGDIAIKITE